MRSHALGLVALFAPAAATAAAAQDMLAIDWLGGLHTIDSVTGVRGQIGATGFDALLHNSLAYDDANGVAYAIAGSNLLSIDPLTASTTVIAQLSGPQFPQSPRGMAYRPLDGMLLGVFDVGWGLEDELWEIDPLTGQGTFIGQTGLTSLQALTYDSAGVLYGCNLGLVGLVTIDQNTGLATDVGPAAAGGDVQWMTETGDGRLLAGRLQIFEVDRVSGQFTNIANVPNEFVDLRGCDWYGIGCETPVVVNRYCNPANANSTGQDAFMLANGCAISGTNRLSISAQAVPASQFGYFLAGQTQGFIPFAGGSQGNLCLSGQVARYTVPIPNSGFFGAIGMYVDLNAIPLGGGPVAVQPGETWNFQAWFRDVNPAPTSNFTDAVSITFQ